MTKEKPSEQAVIFNSIRKLINRFREHPLLFFTESDLHSFLQNDILTGNSKLFYERVKRIKSEDEEREENEKLTKGIPISRVHLEYPTNYRYVKKELLKTNSGIYNKNNDELHQLTSIDNDQNHGDRGNFDLAVLNPHFIKNVFNTFRDNNDDIRHCVKHIINKDNNIAKERLKNDNYNNDDMCFHKEVDIAIEMKYIHPFNARNISMLRAIVQDNEKLRLAYLHSKNHLKPINLIFCSSDVQNRRDDQRSVIDRVKRYINGGEVDLGSGYDKSTRPDCVVNIFVESFLDAQNEKQTPKPLISSHKEKDNFEWANELKEVTKAITQSEK